MWNLLQPAGTGAAAVTRVDRVGVRRDVDCRRLPSVRIELDTRQTVVFEAADVPAELRVLSGSIWITENGIDRVLEAGASVICPRRARTILTSLSPATITMPSPDGVIQRTR